MRGIERRRAQRAGDLLGQCCPSCVSLQLEFAADEMNLVDEAQGEQRVGQSGSCAAAPVADRSRLGPGAVRPNFQEPTLVEP